MHRRLTLPREKQIGRALKAIFAPHASNEDRSLRRYRRIAITGLSSVSSKLVMSLVGLCSVSLTINYLGKAQFGLWMVVSSLIMWLQLADLGFSNGLVNALAEAYGNDDHQSAQAYISTVIVANLILSIGLALPFAYLAFSLPWRLIINTEEVILTQLAAQCFFVAGMVFILSFPLSVIHRIFTAYQLGYVFNLAQSVGAGLSLAGLILVIQLERPLPYLVLAISLGPVFAYLLSWMALRHYLPWYRLTSPSINRRALQRIMNTSIPLFLFQIGSLVVNQTVNILLAQIGTLTLVADYNVVLKVYLFIFTLGACFTLPFYPAIREAYERNETVWVKKAIDRAIRLRTCFILIAAGALPFMGNWLILMWIKKPLDNPFGLQGWMAVMICMLLAAYSSTKTDILIHLDVIGSQLKIVFMAGAVVLLGIYGLLPLLGLPAVFIAMALSTLYPIWWLSNQLRAITK